jgi:peroxiredoxin
MIELGELEAHHEEWDRRQARVVVVSLEGRDDAAKTQARFPHLRTVADADGRLIDTIGVRHAHAAPDGRDAAAPTTILVDHDGIVRWLFRPGRYLTRLTPDDVVAAVDQYLPERPTEAR